MCMNTVYTSIPGLPELGMVWMGDMMMGEAHELMLDPRQGESPFFSHSSHPYEDLRNHHIAPTTMVRYISQQFSNEPEPDEAIEAIDAHEIQRVSFVFAEEINFIFARFSIYYDFSIFQGLRFTVRKAGDK